MKQRVYRYNQKHQLFNQGDTLFLAVSGGPDSLALLHFFASIQSSWNLNLYTLTVDHQLRGQASRDDALFVKRLSEHLGIPCQIGHVNVESYKESHQAGTQVAARELRYQFFKDEMRNFPYAKLVFGHHRDDLIESMVMQFTKGVRPTGIPVKRYLENYLIIRPFLCLTKEDLWQYIIEHDLTPRVDESNQDEVYTRNRVRKHIIPLLKQENPGLQKSVSNLQEQFVEEEELLSRLAKEHIEEIASFEKNQVKFSIKAFQQMAQPLQRRAFHLILNYLRDDHFFEKNYFETFQKWLQSSQSNSQFNISEQLTLVKAYDECQITTKPLISTTFNVQVLLEDLVTLPNGWTIHVTTQKQAIEGQQRILCDSHHIKFPITIRSREAGDRIQPLGMKGHKKIKDIFIDQKIPKYLRDEWPIVVNGDGEIIWIPYICKGRLVKDSGNNLIQITIDNND